MGGDVDHGGCTFGFHEVRNGIIFGMSAVHLA